MNESKRMQQARTGLLLEQPFFGALSLRLRLIEDASVKTACTNGAVIRYNPTFIAGLSNAELKGLVAHEVLLCSNGHPWRRDGRDPKRFNIAADYAINPIIESAGMVLPKGRLLSSEYTGMSAEGIYGAIGQEEEEPGNDGDADEGTDPAGTGGFEDSPGNGEADGNTEAEWKQAVLVAAKNAEKQGTLPSSIGRLIGAIRKPACTDLVSALREFVGRNAREDYSWRRPNTRYIPHGLYMPSLRSESMAAVAIGVDTSGSITDDLLAAYTGALQVVLDECKPESMTVYSADASVHSIAEYLPGDTIATDAKDYPGGGGTDFRPVFTAIDGNDEQPCCAVYLTDLEGSFPSIAPDYPVLWVVADSRRNRQAAPFGETIWID